ncbi:hypothetical protein [Kutzneria sp. CA-103260]|uniref:hypothetical protein n=1 Tax=Kutzneria sp. CA-103260 TaxID=2802641 RepID=UPI001BA518C1|nr:hypothetical protein [Kutzneria sp. CA-103260]QUQ64269.1 hypothetical protein JJ691_19890 [Kutzneria sp. CA-103260]
MPDEDDDHVRNEVGAVDGPAVLAGNIHGGVNIHHHGTIRRWYRDPALMLPAVVTIIAAIIALVPYLFPHQAPDGLGTGKYVDPEQCQTLTWPGPETPVEPQQVRAKEGMAGNGFLRQTPCWRAQTPELSAPFTPESGISVLCSVNADNVYDTNGIPRYGWYLVADPTQPGRTLGWTPQWPYTAPAHDVPTCGPHPSSAFPLVTIAAAALACLAAALLAVAIGRRRRAIRTGRRQ